MNGKRVSDIQSEEEEENELISEQKPLQEELTRAAKMLEEGRKRLAAAMTNREFNDISIAEVFMTAGNAKLKCFENQLIENSEILKMIEINMN